MEGNDPNIPFINLDYFFGKIYDFFGWIFGGLFGDGTRSVGIPNFLAVLIGLLTIGFLFVIFYSKLRLKEIEQEEKKKKHEKLMAMIPEVAPKHEKWQVVQGHIFSQNPAEWRLAIIEADSLLDELTIYLNLPGESLGERLKNATPADFKNINTAWEAHKTRNKIAHQGSDYELTHAEANRVIRMYEDVFNEFKYI